MTDALPVLAVVVATRGGSCLDPVLASLGWAAERAVLDPTDTLVPAALPPGVLLARGFPALPSLGTSPWLLLVTEEEIAPPEMAGAVGRAIAGPAGPWRLRFRIETLGVILLQRDGPVRLAPRVQCRIGLDGALELALEGAAGGGGHLDAALRVRRGDSVGAAADALEPESRARMAILARTGAAPGTAVLGIAPLRALGRVLGARASGPSGMARWIAAVLAAYRVVLTHALLWEWQRAQPAPIRELA
jgi:hypothetical protein